MKSRLPIPIDIFAIDWLVLWKLPGKQHTKAGHLWRKVARESAHASNAQTGHCQGLLQVSSWRSQRQALQWFCAGAQLNGIGHWNMFQEQIPRHCKSIRLMVRFGYIFIHFVLLKSCRYCKDFIELDSIYVHSSAVNNDESYARDHNPDKDIEQNNFHSACFRCSVCDELLVDLVYCMKNNTLYCVRHYAETIKPRCLGCDEVSQQYYIISPLNAAFVV